MSTDCPQIQSKFADYLTGELDAKTVESVRRHVTSCTICGKELEDLTATWSRLGILPEEQPGPNLRKNFYTMLESFQEGVESSPTRKFLKLFKIKGAGEIMGKLWPRRPVYQFMLSMIILLAGVGIGYFVRSGALQGKEMLRLRRQNHQMHQQLAISLLNQTSPSERLKGLTWSSRLEKPGGEILETLLHTLDNDPNINVRLSAVDALYLFAHHPVVRKGLLRSLQKQTSPMMQIALIDLVVEMREKQAAESLKQLIEKNKLNPEVKQRARLSLEELL